MGWVGSQNLYMCMGRRVGSIAQNIYKIGNLYVLVNRPANTVSVRVSTGSIVLFT